MLILADIIAAGPTGEGIGPAAMLQSLKAAARAGKPIADIAKKIKQFQGKSLRDQRAVYASLKKTYEKHLEKYGQTPGKTSGETNRMERELEAMRAILAARGVTVD